MMDETLLRLVLAVIVGVLLGIVYCMRVLVLMERRVAKIERHIEQMISKVLKEEDLILKTVKKPGKKTLKKRK